MEVADGFTREVELACLMPIYFLSSPQGSLLQRISKRSCVSYKNKGRFTFECQNTSNRFPSIGAPLSHPEIRTVAGSLKGLILSLEHLLDLT